MPAFLFRVISCAVVLTSANLVHAQALGLPDRASPGDQQIQDYLAGLATRNFSQFADDVQSLEHWQGNLNRYRSEFLYMLGLHPLPPRTDLHATVTGTLSGEGYAVDMLHYQSQPGLYVTGNLYRPANVAPGQKLPAVFYVCGHSNQGRDGNKTAYQSHGIWFARHGYLCLVVDTLQLGEIAAIHHGTYREQRWWWHSRGYTSAGVECWNGVRGIDYLISRPDVDADRIAVTGISGGGAATIWIAAADERVKVAVPVSGMADLLAYVPNRVINGHCDCMFLYNTFDWPWVRIAGLIAPRPLLFVNSDQDRIFPMDANDRVINQLERLYSLYGASDQVDAVVSVGGHAYRRDLRQAIYRFINLHLKGDPRPVTDSEVDLVDGERGHETYPIAPEKLRVFQKDSDLPRDQINTRIDEEFVPVAELKLPPAGQFPEWKRDLLTELRRVAFRSLPERIPAAAIKQASDLSPRQLETEPGIVVPLHPVVAATSKSARIYLLVQNDESADSVPILTPAQALNAGVYRLEPRGIGATRWTSKNPPNYVERSLVLLGRTVDTGRVRDIIATARYLQSVHPGVPVYTAGANSGAILAAYAAVFEPEIAGVLAVNPPATHMSGTHPQFLNLLRVTDVPAVLGLIAPRPLDVISNDKRFESTRQIYQAADAAERISIHAK